MAGISKAVSTTSVSENRYNPINLGEPLHLQSQVESHVEPYELVELFYGSHSVSSAEHINNSSPSSPQTPPPQVIDQPPKSKSTFTTYKCEICGRVFKEASHFSKHKRGALCRKSAQKLAKKNRKKILKEKDCTEKKTKPLVSPYKPYQCNLCGAKFLDKVNVELHLERTHQTRQPLWLQTSRSGGFACSECDLWFADKTQLRQHQQQHSSANHAPLATSHPQQADPSSVGQSSLPHQTTMPPPPPPQYYFQPLQHIQTFTTNQIHHQLGPPPHQNMQQQMAPQMAPPQGGHPVPAFVVPHPPNPPQTTPSLPQPPLHHHHHHHHHHQPMPNNCLNVPPQIPLSPSSNAPNLPLNSPAVESSSKPLKPSKVSSYSNNWTASRRNICGECGLKFVDPMNLELHMQRKHPSSSIVETVGLGGGLTLYKTNNNSSGNTAVSAPADSPLEEVGVSSTTKLNNNQTFDCVLCGFKAPSMGHIVKHLQNVHNTSNANFIFLNMVGNACSDEKQNGQGVKGFKTRRDPSKPEQDFEEENKCRCDSCSREFESRAALIKHTMKERNFLCGVCNFSSCNDASVSSHMYSSHRESSRVTAPAFDPEECGRTHSPQKDFHGRSNAYSSSPSNSEGENVLSGDSAFSLSETTAITGGLLSSRGEVSSPGKDDEDATRPPRLLCSVCDFYALSGLALAQHLESHGSVRVTCGKCGEFGERFVDIHNHICTAHPGEVTRVSLTMSASSPDSSPSVYMFMITPTSPSNGGPLCNEQLPARNSENESKVESVQTEEEDDDDNDDSILSGEEHVYACSDCGACLTGSGELEAHIALHQFPNSVNRRSSAAFQGHPGQGQQHQHQTPSSLPANLNVPSTNPLTIRPNPLWHRRGTLEFRCHECGFWRVRSGPVLRHIQAVHMSGGMVHSRRLKSGRIKALTIRVFTPLSPLVLS